MARLKINLITGFLGVGKTTTLRHLLAQRPADAKWAVLVNEFGEIGVDGALLDDQGVAIQEVAGGCLCCVASQGFTLGLNRLIREHRPQRILIEPSGLGHPAQVLDTLSGPIYQPILDVQTTVCIMDARHLDSPRHRAHPNFVDQIHLADVLVANKADCYSAHDIDNFHAFARTLQPPKRHLGMVEHGRMPVAWLDLARGQVRTAAFPEAHAFLLAAGVHGAHPTTTDWLLIEGAGDGYQRAGWMLDATHVFARAPLLQALTALPGERIKGIFHCTDGDFSYNRAGAGAEINACDAGSGSRLQLIDPNPIDASAIDRTLRACLA